MSKIEADKFELSYSETNFEQMLQKVVNVINFRVQEKKQSLSVNIGGGIPSHIITDEQRLTQVITNLLTNAVKFTPEGGSITLRAEKTAETEEACTILVEVKDSGIGISAEQQKKLFSLFEQADGSISRRFGGTGLGLAISKRMIELMGGRIWVESEIDKGSSFFFEIEAKKETHHKSQSDFATDQSAAEADTPEPPGTSAESEASLPGTPESEGRSSPPGTPTESEASPPDTIDDIFKGKTILVAEDVDINREIIAALLESTGLSIDFAFDGEEAVNKFSASDIYDLILMDLHMPNVDGLEATRRIRSIEESRRNSGTLLEAPQGIPIIAMTANVFREDVEKCLAAGMNGHLGKPVEIDKVISTLSHYLV
jgi:CheY-like chemotaxis protein